LTSWSTGPVSSEFSMGQPRAAELSMPSSLPQTW
jgi:hypothetical protein